MATRQPALKNFAAVAAPMPVAPPEMNTDLPLDIFGYLQKFIGQNFVSVIFEHSLSPHFAHSHTELRVGQELDDCGCERFGIAGWNENSNFKSQNLRSPPHIRPHNRHSARKRV